ncbi:holo-[acyl-carrier-protein] synthase [bacterium BMS3Abin07]|nr:holo-[acyl-carrier-protein] synthase [bacterium BMS3Abin07]GBE32997.1 holo-[acyl-carrier-protein] synthase [bacterium BMS3Bbin05]HDL20013.1 holo-[acyl-carrier-protein] synthase [Nitrospirota bacterium]HDO22862.1 holo-[acyl-carrier-protein] synthase [Nitrospirota bacterium]HDZ87417.1 holo-[acyl-carrier-protein] synthase [Nitrospirota bacterium]
MIYGIGVDIVKISRIQDAVERWGDEFLRKVYTANEIQYCYTKHVPFLSLAVRFAAKEALIKAISSEIKVSLRDIEVVTSDVGRPYLRFYGMLKNFLSERNISGVHLSLSHEKEFGIASVVLEGMNNVSEG